MWRRWPRPSRAPALAVALDGNGFIAAFVAGAAFGAGLPKDVADVEEVGWPPKLLGEVMALAVWFLFGAALVPVALDHASWSAVAYAFLSLTVVRMVPVALSLVGMGLDALTVAFVGWFGPRGLASVVFALLAIEELGESKVVGQAIAIVTLTVLLSVVAHETRPGRSDVATSAPSPMTTQPRRLGHGDWDRTTDATAPTRAPARVARLRRRLPRQYGGRPASRAPACARATRSRRTAAPAAAYRSRPRSPTRRSRRGTARGQHGEGTDGEHADEFEADRRPRQTTRVRPDLGEAEGGGDVHQRGDGREGVRQWRLACLRGQLHERAGGRGEGEDAVHGDEGAAEAGRGGGGGAAHDGHTCMTRTTTKACASPATISTAVAPRLRSASDQMKPSGSSTSPATR